MSYILDALQRAEAERARGGVPTLHARPVAPPPPHSRFDRHQRVGLTVAAVLGLVLGVAALAWWMWPSASAIAPPIAYTSGVVVAATAPIVAPMPTAVPSPVKPMAPTPPPIAASAEPVVHPKPKLTASATQGPPAKPKTTAPTLKAEPAVTAPSKPKAIEVAKAAVKISTPPTTQKLPAAKTPLPPLLAELPEATRREIPSMTISGAVYSENPLQRLLLVNGLVLSQGSQVAPDLTVVEIRSNSSEFNYRGTRFRMAH